MNQSIEQIKMTGIPLVGEVGSMTAYTGMKAKFSFSCPKCQTAYVSKKEYAMSDNMATTMVKSQASSWISRMIMQLVGNIPVIGGMVSGMASTAAYTAVNAATGGGNMMEKSRNEAFAEVESSFVPCPTCGGYACTSCVQDGKCKACRQA